MIRHGSSYSMAEITVSRPTTRRVPIPELARAQRMVASKSNVVRNRTPYETTPIRPLATLPDHQRLPPQTIPKPLYP
jgi:hypothetical protein